MINFDLGLHVYWVGAYQTSDLPQRQTCLSAMKKCFRIFHMAKMQQSAVMVYNVDPDTSRMSIVHSVADFMEPQACVRPLGNRTYRNHVPARLRRASSFSHHLHTTMNAYATQHRVRQVGVFSIPLEVQACVIYRRVSCVHRTHSIPDSNQVGACGLVA